MDLFDAMDLKILQRNEYLHHSAVLAVETHFDEMLRTPRCQALGASLLHMGCPIQLVEITLCEFILQYVAISYE